MKIVKKFLLLVVVVLVMVPVFYMGSISAKLMTNYDWPVNRITLTEAKNVVKKAGYTPLYAWYEYTSAPAVIVMTKKGYLRVKVEVDAVKGVIIGSGYENKDSFITRFFTNMLTSDPLMPTSAVKNNIKKGQKVIKLKTIRNPKMVKTVVVPTIVVAQPKVITLPKPLVRTVIKPIVDLKAPQIKITFPRNAQVFTVENVIDVRAEVSDNIDSNPSVSGTGPYTLQQGWNSIVVTAIDQAGNLSTAYVLVNKK